MIQGKIVKQINFFLFSVKYKFTSKREAGNTLHTDKMCIKFNK